MIKEIISIRKAYDVIDKLVGTAYLSTCSSDIACLGSAMAINNKNETIDPAIWHDWLEAVNENREPELTAKEITIEEGYTTAIKFISNYAERTKSNDIKEFIKQVTFDKWRESAKEEIKAPST